MKVLSKNKTIKENKIKRHSFKTAWDYSSVILEILFYTLMVLLALSLCVPLVWMIINSLKGYIDYYELGAFQFPSWGSFAWSNYPEALGKLNIVIIQEGVKYEHNVLSLLKNSFIWATVPSAWVLIWTTICAYVLAKYKFPGRNFIFNLGIIVMTIPIIGSLPAQMKVARQTGVFDNMLMRIITSPSSVFYGMTFLMFYGAFKSVPWDYAESVFVDGGGNFRAFISVMFPMIFPTVFAFFILSFIGQWNDYQTFLYWLPSSPNVALGLYHFQGTAANTTAKPVILAGFVIMSIPTSILYLLTQRVINSKLMVGGLKG